MAKNKLNNLFDKINDRKDQIRRTDEDIERLAMEIKTLDNLLTVDAQSGDLETFKKHKAEKSDYEDQVYVLQAYKKTLDKPYNVDEIQKAWSEYETDYEKELDALVSAYKKTAATMYEKFMAIVKLQNDTLKVREGLAEACGIEYINPNSDQNHDPLPSLKMKFFEENALNQFANRRIWQPSAKWILLSGLSPDPEKDAQLFNDVLRIRKSHE